MDADSKLTTVLNIHWGFSLGGVAQYAAVLEGVQACGPLKLSTVCILNRRRHVDEQTMAKLGNLFVIERRGPLDVRWIWTLRSLVRDSAPNLIFTHGFNGHFVAWLTTRWLRNAPRLVASYHGQYHPPTSLKRLMVRIYDGFTDWYIRRKVSAVVSVAEVGKRYLVARGVDADKIHVVHNGIPDMVGDTSREDLRRDLAVPLSATVIGVISRLEPIKGVSSLIEAFRGVANDFPNTFLVVIGVGVEEESLKRLVHRLVLVGRVGFAGFRSGAARYLPAIDVFALPSLSEFHSIGLLEAMRAGRAIIATDVGGNTESVCHGVEGLVVPPGDVGALECALRQLLSDEDLRGRLGGAARARFESEFLVDGMVQRSAQFLLRAARA